MGFVARPAPTRRQAAQFRTQPRRQSAVARHHPSPIRSRAFGRIALRRNFHSTWRHEANLGNRAARCKRAANNPWPTGKPATFPLAQLHPINLTRTATTKMKRSILFAIITHFVLIAFVTSSTGCVGGVVAGPLGRSTWVDKKNTGASLLTQAPPKAGNGRLVVYTVDGAPNLLNSFGLRDLITIGNRAYQIAGSTYFFIDLPAGSHRLTCNNVKKTGVFKESARFGELAHSLSLPASQTVFIKLKKSGVTFSGKTIWQVVEVSPEAAALEVTTLSRSKMFDTGITIDN